MWQSRLLCYLVSLSWFCHIITDFVCVMNIFRLVKKYPILLLILVFKIMKSEINQIILMLLVSLCGISCKSHNLSSKEEQSEIKNVIGTPLLIFLFPILQPFVQLMELSICMERKIHVIYLYIIPKIW